MCLQFVVTVADLPTLPVFPGVSKFFIKSPGNVGCFIVFHQFHDFLDVKKENKTRSGFGVLIEAFLDQKM